ncbi:hypothetical protein PIB30_088317 [Stylosanthes scabra]|uniref:Uncharacterized protein n=1 Tax=Stylosanthes scabra TaxID=79078 RepID=A0ABU6TT70_9FABA|nr:hypothetical protein [Stylosanthes scabra]
METKVQNLSGYCSMRDLNDESSSCGWPLLNGDNKLLTNGQYYNNYLPSSTTVDSCSVYDKDFVKRMMLEHEATFKNQVYELHRLYRIQRDLMNEAKRKQLHESHIPVEASYAPRPSASQIITKDDQKYHISGFPIGNSTCDKTSSLVVEGIHTPLESIKEIGKYNELFSSSNRSSSKDVELLESRPSKVRRQMFDLQLPADEYIDTEKIEKLNDEKTSDANGNNGSKGVENPFCGNGGKTITLEETSNSEQCLRRNGLADLNEPVQLEEMNDSRYIGFRNRDPYQVSTKCLEHFATMQNTQFSGSSKDHFLNSHKGTDSWAHSNGVLENNWNGNSWISGVADAGRVKGNLQYTPHAPKLETAHLSSRTMQDRHSKAHESSSDYLIGQSKANLWRERTISGLHIGEKNNGYSANKNLFEVIPSSDLSKSWSHLASSWHMEHGNLNQKLMSVQKLPFLEASGSMSRSSQSHQSNGVREASYPSSVNSKPMQNGFYPGLSLNHSKPMQNGAMAWTPSGRTDHRAAAGGVRTVTCSHKTVAAVIGCDSCTGAGTAAEAAKVTDNTAAGTAGSTTDNGVRAADTAAAGMMAECTTAARPGSTGNPDTAHLGHGEAAGGTRPVHGILGGVGRSIFMLDVIHRLLTARKHVPPHHHRLRSAAHPTARSWMCPPPAAGYPGAASVPSFRGRGHRAIGLSAPSPEWPLRAHHLAAGRL